VLIFERSLKESLPDSKELCYEQTTGKTVISELGLMKVIEAINSYDFQS